ncbi:rhodanese-like domain-containing protein [Paradesertivirga mongoliensis]|uniref:Rhodanese-like domain-containing protein n=1 Tax=Paradesertivirga mongoliensis TaxID=2100740 RepID=A0ABW4ZQB0_9SPHI|nr:rhodanese-like domain-containing protein [Pedobacter mongoliensis]
MENQSNNDISAEELKEKLSKGKSPHLIDVREELEYHTFNIGGQNIPLGTLSAAFDELDYQKDAEIVVICQRGIRSETARRLLVSAGYKNVKNLTGGLLAYRRVSL